MLGSVLCELPATPIFVIISNSGQLVWGSYLMNKLVSSEPRNKWMPKLRSINTYHVPDRWLWGESPQRSEVALKSVKHSDPEQGRHGAGAAASGRRMLGSLAHSSNVRGLSGAGVRRPVGIKTWHLERERTVRRLYSEQKESHCRAPEGSTWVPGLPLLTCFLSGKSRHLRIYCPARFDKTS